MNPERYRKARELFFAACALDEAERSALLEGACGEDVELREYVERLLAHDDEDASFLERPAVEHPVDVPSAGRLEPGARIGHYVIRSLLGEGGFGEVYLAGQLEPIRREVALKILKPGMDTRAVLARFEAESQALALMDHPAIAKVFDAGATESGRPYFVMERVEGVPLTQYCDEHRLDTRARTELFIRICDATQHAHQKGIIHRDIKPSNILVAAANGEGVPKIIDFGIAKALDRSLTQQTMLTEEGQLIGTPAYMSPEQAAMGSMDIDTRSDIYSLGVVLYELLTGRPPFEPETLRRAGLEAVGRTLRDTEPLTPSTQIKQLGEGDAARVARQRRTDPSSLQRELRDDLDWITMKALEKDRTRRYASASELAAELRRHLVDEPVLAGPPSRLYRFVKFARRHRIGVTAASLVLLALVAGGTAAGWQAAIAAKERNRAVAAQGDAETKAETLSEVNDFHHRMLTSAAPIVARGHEVTVREVLDEAARQIESFSGKPEVEAQVRNTIGISYLHLGKYREAQAQLRKALALFDRILRPKSREALTAMHNLAIALHRDGRFDEADRLAREVVELQTRALGEDHRDTLSSRNVLAQSLQGLGKLDEAEALYRQVSERQRELLGEEDEDTLATLTNLANCLRGRGDLAGAERIYRRVLDVQERVLGEDHPHTMTTISNLGSLLVARGRLPEAEQQIDRALEIKKRVLGDDHASTLATLFALAKLREAQGRIEDAERIYRETIAGQRRVLGELHEETLRSMGSLASLLMDRRRFDEAETLLKKILEVRQREFPERHPETLTAMHNYGTLLIHRRRFDEAEPLLRRTLTGRIEELGEDHGDTLVTRNNLSALLRARGKHDEAVRMARDVLASRKRVHGEEHPQTLIAMSNLAAQLSERGELEEAETLFRRCVAIASRILPDGHWHTAVFRGGLGKVLVKRGEHAEAERFLLEGYRVLKATLGAENDHAKRIVVSLVKLYDATGDATKAAEYRALLKAPGSGR